MKKRQSKVIIALLLSAVWLTALAQPAKAAQVSSGEIPVTIDLGDSLTGEKFEIELKAENPAYPMPTGSKDSIYTVNITGGETSKLPKIDYKSVGTYTYTISQKVALEDSEDYDKKVYLLKVEVVRSQTTGSLQAVSTMYVLGQSAKVAGAVFYNAPPPTPIDPTDSAKEQETIAKTGIKGATVEIPTTSDNTVIWPYIGLFISGLGLAVVIGVDIVKKSKRVIGK